MIFVGVDVGVAASLLLVGDGVDNMYVNLDSGSTHKSMSLLLICVVRMGGEGVGVDIMFWW